jgi:hypothetical protein
MRLAPRSICAIALVSANRPVIRPRVRASSPASSVRSSSISNSVTRGSLAPGVSAMTVSATIRPPSSTPRSVARPESAIRKGTMARQSWNANAREWLNPSPYRNRTNASCSSGQRP